MDDVAVVLDLCLQLDAAVDAVLAAAADQDAAARGWLMPVEDDTLRWAWLGYWRLRSTLLERVQDLQVQGALPAREFQLGLAQVLALVAAARRLRAGLHGERLLRKKFNEADHRLGLPIRSYDRVQRSLGSARNLWRLYELREAARQAEADGLAGAAGPTVAALVRRLAPSLEVSVTRALRVHVGSRLRRIGVTLGRRGVQRGLHLLQELGARAVGEISLTPGRVPGLDPVSDADLRRLLRPGDVIINRKEHYLSTLVLPGFWPHAALVEHCDDEGVVIEAMGDGVLRRPLASALRADRICVLRPLDPTTAPAACARAATHLGKPYDFAFDCRTSDRLVCSEVIYRAYDQLGGIAIAPRRRFGRLTVAPQDLVELALAGQGFAIAAAVMEPGGPVLISATAQAAVLDTVR